ncbi:MAG: DsbA family protein [Candidatus Doudnabacteria bacterium]|nr:DsbA family protein [Candidatus Doudnabacteria bacterium]
MTEHKHPEEVRQSVVVENGPTSSLVLPISILAAALIVAGSLVYSSNGLKGAIEGIRFSGGGSAQAVQTGGQQAGSGTQTAPREITDREGQPTIGNSNAKVTIYEFSDFQCPFCKTFFDQALKEIKTKYIDTGKVKLVYRHFPLPFHQNAEIAGVASECANLQGKFREYHDLLFQNGKSDGAGLNLADLKKYAETLGLNKGTFGFAKNKFNQCLDNKETLQAVQGDMTAGTSYGVTGTPTFFIGGKIIVGAQPFATFEQAIEEALK